MKTEQEITKYYVLYVQARTERKVEKALNKIGINAYVPIQRQLHQWKDRKSWVDTVLFNNYVFVEATPKSKNSVFNVNHIKKFVQFEGKPACLNSQDIELIHHLCLVNDHVEICQNFYCKGQEVQILSGQLIGQKGKIIDEPNGKKLRIEIESLGCFAKVALEAFNVRVI